ncbi:MAG TPA: DUF3341 domain-containing protein [Methylocella sp.]|nr:DUF3341 domain-containing protein [Methylocella sp.]
MNEVLVASFETEGTLVQAMAGLRAEGIRSFQTYTPKALEGDERANSPLPKAIFIAGVFGFAAGLGMQSYADVVGYPLDIGGRPEFSWPAFVPIAFEIAILCAVLTGVFGYLIVNRMPRLYDPIDECLSLRDAMRDGWVVAIRLGETSARERAREILTRFRPALIEEVTA